MSEPEIRELTQEEVDEFLHEWVNGLDVDDLARIYSLHVLDADVAVRVNNDGEYGNYYMGGKRLIVRLVPAEGGA